MTAAPAEPERFVHQELARGRFRHRDDVVAHAIRLMPRERDETVRGIQLGPEDPAAGSPPPLAHTFGELHRKPGTPADL